MLTTSCYPVVMTDDVVGTVAFYQEFFPFQPAFAIGWYVHLTWQGDSGVNLAVMDGQHDSIPASHRGTVSGLILNFEVEEQPDAVHVRITAPENARDAAGELFEQFTAADQANP